MHHSDFSTTMPDASAEQGDSPEFLTDSYRNAIGRLNCSFQECHPVAVVIGEGRSASRVVIERFLAGLDEEIAIARITAPCADGGDLMRQIVEAVGFESKDMGVTDLQSVLSMFLSFQKGHARRTIICLEQIQDSDWWVLDKIRDLVDLEEQGKFGLMLLLTGQPSLKKLLHTRPLNAVSLHAGQRISLNPFTITETTEYIRRRVEGISRMTIDQAFHFQAIETIQELSAGVPDAISSLVSLCIDLADEASVDLVTTDLVTRAHEFQRAATSSADADAVTVNLKGLKPRAGRLIVQITGEQMQEMAVRHGHILIGRGKLCDIRIGNTTVSRHHALISYTPEGVMLVDLGSTNGTYVDGHQIDSHSLVTGESITVGDCKIEYTLDDERQPGVAIASGELPSRHPTS